MAFLIDTDIIIYSLKGSEPVHQWMLANKNLPKFISVVTYGELVYGARKSQHPEKNMATANRVAELFPIIDISKGIMEVFGDLKARLESSGKGIDDMDLFIAATAMYMNLSLLTNNKAHFSRIGDLKLESLP